MAHLRLVRFDRESGTLKNSCESHDPKPPPCSVHCGASSSAIQLAMDYDRLLALNQNDAATVRALVDVLLDDLVAAKLRTNN